MFEFLYILTINVLYYVVDISYILSFQIFDLGRMVIKIFNFKRRLVETDQLKLLI